jgi:high-affinity K+ transport system ATPase subunit B
MERPCFVITRRKKLQAAVGHHEGDTLMVINVFFALLTALVADIRSKEKSSSLKRTRTIQENCHNTVYTTHLSVASENFCSSALRPR